MPFLTSCFPHLCSDLPCETGIDMENQHWDSSPEGTERCQCHRSGRRGQMPYFDGPQSAAQCAHLICHKGMNSGYDWCERNRLLLSNLLLKMII